MQGDFGRGYDRYEDISDDDMREAWEELNRFLDEDDFSDASTASKAAHIPETLRKDYETLGLPPGAPFDAVKKAYREKLRAYHPDLHAAEAGKQREATEITQKLILAFRRIKVFHETGRV
ncbi:MAG: J domain-containing protein [Spirochaetales bacterium]|nr:J domain-containing protein [Spirochaetales bacterium]